MNTILIAILSITLIGMACAAILSIVSKLMHVTVDERIEQISAVLPGTNCGACGFPGCGGYAAAMVEDSAVKSSLCTPGGAEAAAQISGILGVEGEAVARRIAVVHCGGDHDAQKKKMTYTGIQSCYAAAAVFCGGNACAYGCLGYGDCKPACPFDAICITDGLARVNGSLCTGCGLCVAACPRKLFSVRNIEKNPASEDSASGNAASGKAFAVAAVACSNIEKAVVVRKKCSKACICCGRCVRECPEKAMVIENNLAKIDYEKCSGCGYCAVVCPTKCVRAF